MAPNNEGGEDDSAARGSGNGKDSNNNNTRSKTVKRSRWATRKMTVKSSSVKRLSLLGRHQNKASSAEKKRASGGSETMQQGDKDGDGDGDADSFVSEGNHAGPRKLYFNMPLPPHMVDEDGHPLQTFTRNKIRTAKYTPLSFIPKDLWFQFHNIANVFFLFLVILDIFPIFGGTNPGLNAVPLIVIICITAIKDAIEDYRRTVLDNALNNASVHRLNGWNNVNVEVDNVSAWRKVKKATSRFFGSLWHLIGSMGKKPPPSEDSYDEPRRSSVGTRRESMAMSPHTNRASYMSGQEDIPMTPVPSPLPRHHDRTNHIEGGRLEVPEAAATRPTSGFSFRGDEQQQQAAVAAAAAAAAHAVKGNLINYDLPAEGKARFHKDAWKSLQVGDFVRIYNDDELPADVIILATSDPDGACYVETKNLDGETNLKVRSALRCGRTMKHARDCERAQFIIDSEPPQANLYKYNGAITWEQRISGRQDAEPRQMAEPITIDNVLLRGCNLRNTEWVLGVVLFTGHDTKIMMNAGISPRKRPRIAREMNWNVITNFGILIIMCLIAAVVNGFAWGISDGSLTFFEYGSIGGTPALSGFITFWAAIIIFQNLIPISLYISLEIVRTLQAYFIYSDVEMYYEKIDQPCIPKSWNISDDVGQIEYIFSDKTGTLTQNVMEFKKTTINGQPYGEAYTEAQAGMQKRLGVDVEKEAARARLEIAEAKIRALRSLREINDNPYLVDDDLTFIAPDFVDDLSGKHGPEQQAANEHFMLALALCHTVIAERLPGEPPRLVFKAQSPDEAALVATARDMGFTVLGHGGDGILLNVMGEVRHYPVLNVIEFNSSRKRMSAIVRMPDGRIVLFCKGADSIIYSRLKKGEQPELRRTTAEHLEMFAREGLRTLCIAERELGEDEYLAWKQEHHAAATALTEREEKLEAVADRIEQELTLLGGTAIEDRLQDGVPDAIALLGEAGIKLWVLTGDKVETAINIGFSCNLLNNDMELIHLKVDEDEAGRTAEEDVLRRVEEELDRHLQTFGITGSDDDLAAARKNHEPPAPTHALVIDGFTLKLVLQDGLKQKFLLLCKQCKSVLCCRVSPAQKAAVVSMVKNGLDVMTLSVGDGANDVAMIQEADVGVGIAGEEGRQAAMSSDYAIGQFRFLQRLVLVHGRWSYRRLAESIANFFYKNLVWVFSIFWFQIFCNYDMTYIFDITYILMFNLLFTSVPVILMGVLDQDVPDTVSLAVPELYRRGIERLEWTQRKFWLYMADGVYQAVVCFFVPYLAVIGNNNIVAGNGLDVTDRERLGCYIVHPAVLTINLYILINTYRWDWLMLLVVALSDMFIFFWTGVYTSTTYSGVFFHAAPQVYAEASFWAVFFITPVICMFPRFAIKAMQKVWFPYDVDIIREQITMGRFDHLIPGRGGAADDDDDDDDPVAAALGGGGGDKVPSAGSSRSSKHSKNSKTSKTSRLSRKGKHHAQYASVDEDRRPIYPPSLTTTHTRTQNGSDGTNYLSNRESYPSADATQPQEYPRASAEMVPVASRPSIDRARPSYDRMRASMDRMRQSYEASNDFTSAARLTRIESTHSAQRSPTARFFAARTRGLSIISHKSKH